MDYREFDLNPPLYRSRLFYLFEHWPVELLNQIIREKLLKPVRQKVQQDVIIFRTRTAQEAYESEHPAFKMLCLLNRSYFDPEFEEWLLEGENDFVRKHHTERITKMFGAMMSGHTQSGEDFRSFEYPPKSRTHWKSPDDLAHLTTIYNVVSFGLFFLLL